MSNHFAEQQVTLDYEKAKVLEAIKSILEEKKLKYPHTKGNINETFGTFQFFEASINSLQFNITLKELESNKTEIVFRVVPEITSRANSATCAQGITRFQNHISNKLEGKPLEAGTGCSVLVLAIISATIYLFI